MPDNTNRTEKPLQMQAYLTSFSTREEGDDLVIEGYFATFEGEYVMGNWGVERIDRHAFDETLQNDDPRVLINHDSTLVLGRKSSGTAEFWTDDRGLWVRTRINRNDQDALNCRARVMRGDVNQASFGFDILDEKEEKLPDGRVRWTLLRVKLYEVSVCTFPAYEDTAVVARARELETLRERELDAWKGRMINKLIHKKEDALC